MKALVIIFIAACYLSYNQYSSLRAEAHSRYLDGIFAVVASSVKKVVEQGNWEKTQREVESLSEKLGVDLILSLDNGQVIGVSRPELQDDLALRQESSSTYSKSFATDVQLINRRLLTDPVSSLILIQPESAFRLQSRNSYIINLLPFFGISVFVLLFSQTRSRKALVGKMKQLFNSSAKDPLGVFEDAVHSYETQIEERREEINQNSAILSSMSEGVLAVDGNGCLITINPTGAELLGINRDESMGEIIEKCIPSFEFQTLIRSVLNSGASVVRDVRLSDKLLYFRASKILKSPGVLVVFSDVTKIRQLDRLRKEFISNVSHELKTPVTAIKGFCETLLDGDTPDQKKYLKIIFDHSTRLQDIINDLLKLARLEGGQSVQLESRPVKPLVEEVLGLYREKATATLSVQVEDSLKVFVDPSLLKQALANLVENALKYSPAGSEVVVSARTLNDEVLISVSDEGCGIPEEDLPRVFERFYVVDKARTRESGGTGLGLSIVKHISYALRGYVTVKSEINKGSVFTIHLPKDS